MPRQVREGVRASSKGSIGKVWLPGEQRTTRRFVAGFARLALAAGCVVDDPKGPGLPNPAPVFRTGASGRADPKFSAVEYPEEKGEMLKLHPELDDGRLFAVYCLFGS